MRLRLQCYSKMLNSFGFHMGMKKVFAWLKKCKMPSHKMMNFQRFTKKNTLNFICMKSRTPILHSFLCAVTIPAVLVVFSFSFYLYCDFWDFDSKSQLKISIEFWQTSRVNWRMKTKLPKIHWFYIESNSDRTYPIKYCMDLDFFVINYNWFVLWSRYTKEKTVNSLERTGII